MEDRLVQEMREGWERVSLSQGIMWEDFSGDGKFCTLKCNDYYTNL